MALRTVLAALMWLGGFNLVTSADPAPAGLPDEIKKIDLLPPKPGNPRNSEGDFIALADGRILFIYTHFTGGAGDASAAHLASRVSEDGGLSWSDDDVIVVPNEAGQNVMSVSLLRLADGRIALFYLKKDSKTNCRPVMRTSADEATSWSEPVEIIPEPESGYCVLNNDRAVQLEDGRIVLPLAQHFGPEMPDWKAAARLLCYISEDAGSTWKRGRFAPSAMSGDREVVLQEPGVVEIEDDRLWMFARTDAGSQFACESNDGGISWSEPRPTSLHSPLSPASIERMPPSKTLVALWNDHENISPELRNRRTPLAIAVSSDEAKTWRKVMTLEDDPHGWYCYTAIAFTEDRMLLAYCAGDRRENNGLAATRITSVPLSKLRTK